MRTGMFPLAVAFVVAISAAGVGSSDRARAADVKALIDLARDRVRGQFGVELELEVGLVGEGFDG